MRPLHFLNLLFDEVIVFPGHLLNLLIMSTTLLNIYHILFSSHLLHQWLWYMSLSYILIWYLCKFSSKHQSFLAAVQTEVKHTQFSEAVKHSKWRSAMKDEINALENNTTWTLTSLPSGKWALDCKWVYWIKLKSDGTIEWYKAHLVFLGNTQIEGQDITVTFAPVVKLLTFVPCLQ